MCLIGLVFATLRLGEEPANVYSLEGSLLQFRL